MCSTAHHQGKCACRSDFAGTDNSELHGLVPLRMMRSSIQRRPARAGFPEAFAGSFLVPRRMAMSQAVHCRALDCSYFTRRASALTGIKFKGHRARAAWTKH